MSTTRNWIAVSESKYPRERDALEFVRAKFPVHEAYRAWANFEFIADDGTVNEVDLLLFSSQGFFLVEIKSNPGVLGGDSHTWRWQQDGRTKVVDNPVFLANQKAKKLASLLQRQRGLGKTRVPLIEPLIFCSAENLQCHLQGHTRFLVCLRDHPEQPGVLAAIQKRDCPGLAKNPRGTFDSPTARAVSRALEQAGIRPSQRSRRVGDYELQQLLDEGPGYQDFLAKHVALNDTLRRIRIFTVRAETDPEQRLVVQRAAEREFRLLQTLEHRGTLRAMEFTNHELGPAIIFQHFPSAIRLDHYLTVRKEHITDDLRLGLMRQIADTIAFAHDKHVVHRSLNPRSILVANPESTSPQTVVMNWQLGYRQAIGAGTVVTKEVTPTIHLEKLAEETSKVFMAPEAFVDFDTFGEHHDIFSLGVVCYQLFTGQAPAESALALAEKLRAQRGLRVSAVLNGAPESLDELVRKSTDPDVSERMDTAVEFTEALDRVELDLATPAGEFSGDPTQAKLGVILPGGFEVIRKLGTGSTATALLVRQGERNLVAKIAVDTDHNDRVRDEVEVLQKLDSPLIVRCHGAAQLGERAAILLDPAGESDLDSDKKKPITRGDRLREEGRLSLDLLERFGTDLLDALIVLERAGINHRDIKPHNIGVSRVGRGDALHLVLFDFSLSRCSPENIRAGTPGYLDPFLPLRNSPRWDLQAERFSAAVTLYQMATGLLPVWHDGKTDPTMVESEATIATEQFVDPNLRQPLTEFFRRALRRNPRERFDNAEKMLEAWQKVFSTVSGRLTITTEGQETDNSALLAAATIHTSIAELGLGPAAVDALDRFNVVTVRELLRDWGRKLARMRGVGNKTRKRILAAVKSLRERLRDSSSNEPPSTSTDAGLAYDGAIPQEQLSIDMLAGRILRAKAKSRNATETTALEALLGLDDRVNLVWPSQGDIAPLAGVTRGRISQILAEAQSRWLKDPAITAVRDGIAVLLESNGGVMSAEELRESLLAARGSIEDEPRRSRLASVVTRAAVETENLRDEPKYVLRRIGSNAVIAIDMSLADYAVALGQKADAIAKEDPFVPPARVVEILCEIPVPPEAEPLSDARLIRLAAAASQVAAISSKQEIYPRNMDAGRALKLSHGSVVGVRYLTADPIRQRFSSRYPLAARLPGRPQIDKLITDAGLELKWNPDHPRGGIYASTARNVLSVSDVTSTGPRYSTSQRWTSGTPTPEFLPAYVPQEIAEARAFEERLRYAEKNGSFLALTVKMSLYDRARKELTARFATRAVDLEREFLAALRQAAEEVGADWSVVLHAEAADRRSEDWRNWNHLIASNVIPRVEKSLSPGDRTVLAFHLNWLERYGQKVLLSRVAQAVQDGRLHGAWLLIPASPQTPMPLLDGAAVPVITNNQWAHIPESWCQNVHGSSALNSTQVSPAVPVGAVEHKQVSND